MLTGASDLMRQAQARQQALDKEVLESKVYRQIKHQNPALLLAKLISSAGYGMTYNDLDKNNLNIIDLESKFIFNSNDNPFIDELIKRVSKLVVNKLMQAIYNTSKSFIDITDRNFNPITIYNNITDPHSHLPEWQANSLGKYHSIAISADEFIDTIKGLSKNKTKRQTEGHGLFNSQSGGPSARYVLDPANHERVIDMRHFLSIGDMGEAIGLVVEVMQSTREVWRSSAFDLQDFYSNNLGQQFYQSGFYQQYRSGKVDFPTALDNFFKNRAKQ